MHKTSRLPSDTSPRNPPKRTKDNLKILHYPLILNPLHVIPNLIRHNLLNISLIRIFSLPKNHIIIHILYRCPVRNTRSNRQHLLLFLSEGHAYPRLSDFPCLPPSASGGTYTSSILHLQYILRHRWLIWPILHLQNHASTFKRPHSVPLTCRNIQSYYRSVRR